MNKNIKHKNIGVISFIAIIGLISFAVVSTVFPTMANAKVEYKSNKGDVIKIDKSRWEKQEKYGVKNGKTIPKREFKEARKNKFSSRQTKNRKVILRERKFAVCHIPPGNPDKAHTINVGRYALKKHIVHGDYRGPCIKKDDGDKEGPSVADADQADNDGDGMEDTRDNCPDDSHKTAQGVCGCGVADTDSDGDGTADCNDRCPGDTGKITPGICGCGVADTDSDGDGTADCNDVLDDSPYYPGFIWRLSKDYDPGTVRYSTIGNPDDDTNGIPTWSYEWINTSGIGMDEPWYAAKSTLLTWDSFRYNRDTWATYDGGVNLGKWQVNYSLSNNGVGKAPLIRWTNPTNKSIHVNIYGRFRLNWFGLNVNPNWRTDGNYWDSYLVGSPADVDLVIGHYDASEGTTDVLSINRVRKPEDGETTCIAPNYDDCDHEFVYINSELSVNSGDSIFWTARPLKHYSDRNRWITMDHGNITIRIMSDEDTNNGQAVLDRSKFYAVEPAGSIQRLVSIDPDTLEVDTVLNLTGQIGFRSNAIAFSPDGQLYGWNNHWKQLYRIDLTTGEVIHIGEPAAIKWVNSLAFDEEGNLYGLHGPTNELLSVDLNTGRVSVIGSLGLDIKHNGLAVDFETGELYAVSGLDADYLLRIDKITGYAEIIGSLGVEYGGVAVEFNPATGELFTVRRSNILMKIDIYTGEATEVGILEGIHTVNLAAPWPFIEEDEDDEEGDDGGKVTICHIPHGNPDNVHTINIGSAAVAAHLAHGDYLGSCGAID